MHQPNGTYHLIDPQLLPVLDMLPAFAFSAETLPAIRASLAAQIPERADPVIAAVEHVIAGPDGPIDLFWFDPAPGARDRPVLLHIHGGGMVIGSARQMQTGPSTLAASLGIPVASVEYRLAPEGPFPGPQEDCYAALAWLATHAAALGINPARIGVTGESAGGGLAAAVAMMARDRNGPAIAAQILVYPMLDHRVGGDADPWNNHHTGEFVWTRSSNRFGWACLKGNYTVDDARKGWFSPSRAEDLAGLPPAWIGVGTLDLFFDENIDYARRLVDASVNTELHCYPGAFHGFNMMSDTKMAKAFSRDMLDATRRLLNVP